MYYLQKFQTVFAKNQSNLSKYWILKYQNWDTQTSEPDICKSFINERAIRYADVILMLAEAQMNLGNYPDAANYLNKIRERANLKDYSGALTKEGIFADLEQQRAVEFWDEGERFYDIRRWGLLEETLKTCDATKYANYISGKLSDGTNKYDYFPIPAKEIQTNLLCTQSAGW